MERTAELQVARWRAVAQRADSARWFVGTLGVCVLASAVLASWLPLQVSIITVFLFAGPHNWFEFRYFLMRLPARFGRSRTFFVTAFAGLAVLTITYVSLPFLYQTVAWSNETWLTLLASWNTLMLGWLALLIHLRAKQKRASDWFWTMPLLLTAASLNWLAPELFSLAIVYIHPLIALWFLDRQLRRSRPAWLGAYRRCLLLLPLIVGVMIWQLSGTTALASDNGLFWRITQHSGAQLLPQVSTHLLVSVHLFLEMLHYGVWIFALPLLGPGSSKFNATPKTFPRTAVLVVGVIAVVLLWVGFTANYTETRDLYFTIAIAHVLAEAPFLLKTL
ncbi:MAG TPA: hypothetical protein VGW58_09100, partial [Pyrinomonadaceae bacterium]|nr:hypothetical protein [Pyrinomonadaceae bacterium]